MSASARSRVAPWNAPSKSPGSRTSSDWSGIRSVRAARCVFAKLGIGMIWVPQDGHAGYPRRRVSEQLNWSFRPAGRERR